MAFIRELRGTFYGRWRDAGGRQVERVMEASSRRAALLEALEHEREARRVRSGQAREFAPISFRATWERFSPLAQTKASWASIEGRFRLHLLPHFGDWDLHTIRPADVDRLLASKLKEGLSPQSVKHLRNHLSKLFNFAIRKEKCFVGPNPVLDAERIAVPEAPVTFIEREHVFAIINTVAEDRRNFFALAVYTGARSGELKGLRVASVDVRRRVLNVWRSNSRDLTKGKRARLVPVPQEAVPYLEDALAKSKKAGSEWLFPAKGGGRIPASTKFSLLLRTALKTLGLVEGYLHECVTRGKRKGCGTQLKAAWSEPVACERCGRVMYCRGVPLKLSFKALRATYATHLYEATSDIRLVQKMLGHQDVSTTEKYVGRMTHRLVERADALSFAPRPVTAVPAGSAGEGGTEDAADSVTNEKTTSKRFD